MKVKALSRSSASIARECSGDVRVQHRNLSPKYHPMQRAREYQRAVTGAKLDRMFAAPFLAAIGEHRDSVTAAASSRTAMAPYVSGAADGEVRVWDIPSRTLVQAIPGAHSRAVTGLVLRDDKVYSCSDDGFVKLWSLHPSPASMDSSADSDGSAQPLETWRHSNVVNFKCIDHHFSDQLFVTASDASVDIWSPDRSAPVASASNLWGSDDTVTVARYNTAERSLLGVCTADRGVALMDTRAGLEPLRRVILEMRCNCFQWNPMEPMNFLVGSEDYNAYAMDMRRMDRPTLMYKGHVGAVMDLSWSPTGQEFVTASYDKTLRIWDARRGTSRDMYHTKRMQRVFTATFSGDGKYILSGSEDTNIRLWKAKASQKIGQVTLREESSMRYRQSLVRKYQHMPEVKRILRSGPRTPKLVKKQTAVAQIQKESATRKLDNVIRNSKPGSVKIKGARDKTVVRQEE